MSACAWEKFRNNSHYEVLGDELIHFKNNIKPAGFDGHARCDHIVFIVCECMDRWHKFDVLLARVVAVGMAILLPLQIAGQAAVGRHDKTRMKEGVGVEKKGCARNASGERASPVLKIASLRLVLDRWGYCRKWQEASSDHSMNKKSKYAD